MIEGIEDQTLYYIAMIAIYSGLLPWLTSIFTRSKADERNASRAVIDETLSMVERLRAARAAAADPARQASYDAMIDRLLGEANDRIAELNAAAEREHKRPSERYIVIPAPRSAFGAVLTVLFIGAVYFALMFLLTVAFDFWNDPNFDVVGNPEHQLRALFLGGGAVALGLAALLLRFLAFRSYDGVMRRLRDEADSAAKGAGAA
ncbi:MAG: hypothetical protein AAF909_02990 [Pseudomonadota bacterium]